MEKIGGSTRASHDKKTVLYDGKCPMCTVFVDTIDDSSRKEQFSLQDMASTALPPGVTREAVEKEIHVIGKDGKVYRGAEGILAILEEYPRLRFLARFGRYPVVRNMLPFMYMFIARRRYFFFGPASRVYWTKTITALGLLLGIFLSLPVWVGERAFPLVPIARGMPALPFPFDWLLFLAALVFLIASVFSAQPKRYLLGTCILCTILILFDQMRFQPWVYQYLSLLFVIGIFSWRPDDTSGRGAVLSMCRFVIASMFFWAGVQKMSPQFLGGVFPWMIQPTVDVLPGFLQKYPLLFGFLVPPLEAGIGIALLSKRYRNIGIGFAVCMCIFVLWSIGPFGHNWNTIVWPWNVVLVLLVFVLFMKTPQVSFRETVWVPNSWLHKAVLLFFGVMPLFYFFNIWDAYPSWSLYGGTTSYGTVFIGEDIRDRLPEKYVPYIESDGKGKNYFDLLSWAIEELNVPPYPETRVFVAIAKELCLYAREPSDVVLVMTGRKSWFNGESEQRLTCREISS